MSRHVGLPLPDDLYDDVTPPPKERTHYVNALAVGAELDAEVARVVFRHTGLGYYGPPEDGSAWEHSRSVRYDTPDEAQAAYLRHYASRYPDAASRRGKADPDAMSYSLCHWKDGWGPMMVDQYSTEIDAAWQVVEQMRQLEWRVRIGSLPSGSWWIVFSKYDDQDVCRKSEADGLITEAICRAALKALERRQ